jgi:hypothetical protein
MRSIAQPAFLGSARASRAGFGALAETIFLGKSPRWRGRHRQHARRVRSPDLNNRAHQRFTRWSRNAFAITETELKLIAAPAMIGLRSNPKNG